MSFKLVCSDTKRFTSIIDVVELLVDEVLLKVDKSGVHLVALDKGHISFIKVDLSSDYFVDYSLENEDTQYEVLVDTLQLKQVLHRGGSDELVIEYDPTKENLNIIFHCEAKKKFSLSTIGDDYQPPNMPSIDYDVAYEVSWKAFKDSLGDAGLYGDTVRLSNRSGLGVFSTGEYGEYSTVIPSIDEDRDDDGVLTSIYSLEKLKDTSKLNISEYVAVEFGDDIPLLLTWSSIDESAKVQYLLAPRIDNSD